MHSLWNMTTLQLLRYPQTLKNIHTLFAQHRMLQSAN
jgi:hypothetical protein